MLLADISVMPWFINDTRFAALVVVGDGKGNVGYGTGKAIEVPEAIKDTFDKQQ